MKITSMRTLLMRACLRELGARGFSDHRIAEAASIDPQGLLRLRDFGSKLDTEAERRFLDFASNALIERRVQAARAVSLARISIQHEARP